MQQRCDQYKFHLPQCEGELRTHIYLMEYLIRSGRFAKLGAMFCGTLFNRLFNAKNGSNAANDMRACMAKKPWFSPRAHISDFFGSVTYLLIAFVAINRP